MNKYNKLKENNLYKNSVATIISMVLYVFVSIAVIAIVTTFATNYVDEYQQRYKYTTMIEQINKLDSKINEIANNKLNSEIVKINNPEFLEIDCNNNTINGSIAYNLNYKNEINNIQGISTYKKLGKIYFKKNIGFENSLNLDCKNIILNKGRNILEINYFNFNEEKGVVNIDIIRHKNKTNNLWYNSNWYYRNKITINSDDVNGDLENFPVLIKTNNFDLLQHSKHDGSDIVFTTKDGKTKLSREIDSFTSTKLPYYIEETTSNDFYIWTKTDISANDTTTIYLKKEIGNTPNGDDVFLFYDDFDEITSSQNKWTTYSSSTATLEFIGGHAELYSTNGPSIALSTYTGTDYTINAETKHDGTLGLSMGVIARGNSTGSYYHEEIDQTKLHIYKFTNWVYTNLESSNTITIDPNTWYPIELKVDRNKIIDQSFYHNLKLNTEDNSFTSGYAGLQVYSQKALFDNFLVRKFADIEPIITIEKLENDIYKIKVTNINNYDLKDYQIKIPTDTINISNKNESLKLYSGELIAWVNTPQLSSTKDSEIYMYYGNDKGNEINNENTWDPNFIMVQHFNEKPANEIENGYLDSTRFNNNGMAYHFNNNINSNVDSLGKIGTAVLFDGNDDYIYIGNQNDFDLFNEGTVCAWYKINVPWNGGTYPNLISKGAKAGWDSNGWALLSFEPITDKRIGISFRENSSTNIATFKNQITNDWIFVCGSWDGEKIKVYENNIKKNDQLQTIKPGMTNDPLIIGKYISSNYGFNGYISEVKISNIARNEDWIFTEFNNQNKPDSFITINNTETN